MERDERVITVAAKKTTPSRKTASKKADNAEKVTKPADTSDTDQPVETAGDTTPPDHKDDQATEKPENNAKTEETADPLPAMGKSETPEKVEGADDTHTDDTKENGDGPETGDAADPSPAMGKSETPEKVEGADETHTSDTEKVTDKSETDETAHDGAKKTDQTAHLPATSPAESGGGGGGSMILGGIVAALIGAGAAYFILPQLGVLERPSAEALSTLETRLDDQSAEIADLSDRLESAESQSDTEAPDLSGIESSLDDLGTRLDDLTERMETIDTRVSDLEARPTAPTEGGSGATSEELADLRETLNTQREQIETLMDNAARQEEMAQQSARDTLRRAALTRLQTALDTGAPFDTALSDLRDTGQDIPAPLSQVAETGVPTLSDLRQSFPDAARDALTAARRSGSEESENGGFASFLSSQLGVRSLEPREGSGPDAVLSRAEAALREGRLADTLAELEALPEEARTELSDWMDRATTRLDAVNAADSIGAQLN
ncbi:COG4223 family protein [Roseovarius sp. E0-M6]|uniref:COG4223 family protein n=1 Tax=Roseovarius sp. E0-M6 TaxID=3127118 RepID=UPI00300FBB2F